MESEGISKIFVFIIFLLGVFVGILFYYSFIYQGFPNDKVNDCYQRTVDGAYLENYSINQARDYINDREPTGDWILVNVRGMNYSRMIEVCNHEAGHKIFAEVCETNITKCIEIIQ